MSHWMMFSGGHINIGYHRTATNAMFLKVLRLDGARVNRNGVIRF